MNEEDVGPEHEVVVAADLYTVESEDAVEGVPWIYLRCETSGCPWWLGFAQSATITGLALAAERHEREGQAWLERREALAEGTESEGDEQ